MADVTVKEKDTYPYVEAVLESNGNPIKLAEAKEIIMRWKISTVQTGKCEYPAPETGNVIYKQKNTDFTVPGEYPVEWQIEWNTGLIETIPNEGTKKLEVEPRIK